MEKFKCYKMSAQLDANRYSMYSLEVIKESLLYDCVKKWGQNL